MSNILVISICLFEHLQMDEMHDFGTNCSTTKLVRNTFMSITLSTFNQLYCNCSLIGMQLIWNVVQMGQAYKICEITIFLG